MTTEAYTPGVIYEVTYREGQHRTDTRTRRLRYVETLGSARRPLHVFTPVRGNTVHIFEDCLVVATPRKGWK